MTAKASINIHDPELKAKITDHGWFKSFEIAKVSFFLDTSQELVNFKNAVDFAYAQYLRKETKNDPT